jgi:eukaryotic-like serine/threonine-protein kinase
MPRESALEQPLASIDPQSQPEELKRGSRLGKYELLLRIGRGGMATVWVARELGQKPEESPLLAVKAILSDLAGDQEFSKMFLDEGRIVKMIRNPHVVDVYEAGEDRGIMYISMEWVEGDSLHAIIAEAGKRRPIPPEMAVRIISDAAAGLHAAHELKDDAGHPMNVVHRDVSPHNILLGVDGGVKLVDFGVAKAMGRLSEVTSAGQLKGKFGYMSPEQAMAKRVDRRSDIFALGIVLFELTTGRRLFRGEHDAETLHMVVSGKIPQPSSIIPGYPAALESIVMKALTRDPAKRHQTAAELQKELEAYLKAERVVVPRAGIANLLKKVLGPRNEQRRKAIRASIKAIDQPMNAAPSAEAPFAPVSGDHVSVTGVSAVTGGSGISQVSQVSSPTASGVLSDPRGSANPPLPGEASTPSAVSQVLSSPGASFASGQTVVVKRGGMIGLVVGVIGLAVALAAVLFVLYGPWRKTTVVNLQSPAAPPPVAAQPTPTATEPAPTATEKIPELPVDSLSAHPEKPPTPHYGRAPAKPRQPVTPSTATPAKPPPTPTAPAELPRKNPYE